MKKFWYGILIFCILNFYGCAGLGRLQKYPSAAGLKVKEITIEPPQDELRVGEKLIYTIRWLGIPVGTLSLQVKTKGTLLDEKEVYQLVGQVHSNAFLSHFYRIDDFYQSYMDAQNHFSRRFEKKVSEGRYKAEEVVTFYPDQKKGVYYAPKKNETKEFAIPGAIQDILSCIYYFRVSPFQTSTDFVFPVVSDEKVWQVTMKTVEQGILEVRNLGVHEAFLIEPIAVLLNLPNKSPKGKIWIWFSADKKRIPLIIRGEMARIGEIIVTLEAIE